jgi:eukaryotic-like serine/threonine-protein kinase
VASGAEVYQVRIDLRSRLEKWLDAARMRSHSGAAWSPPKSFDGFELRSLLGEGGMGRVYLAYEDALDRLVAIKFISSSSLSQQARDRFLIEARAVARLRHTNIVAVHRIGEVEGQPYVAYEYVAGSASGGPWPPPTRGACSIAMSNLPIFWRAKTAS